MSHRSTKSAVWLGGAAVALVAIYSARLSHPKKSAGQAALPHGPRPITSPGTPRLRPPETIPAAAPKRTADSITRADLVRFLDRRGRTVEALAFAASMLKPIDPEFLEAARALDPDSALVAALDVRIALERSIRPGPAQDREAFARLVETLIKRDPENQYYQRLAIHALILKREHAKIPAALDAIPAEVRNGNLTPTFKTNYVDFATHELGLPLREALLGIPFDHFTSVTPEGTSEMMAFALEKQARLGPSGAENLSEQSPRMVAQFISLLEAEQTARDDVSSLVAQLQAESRLIAIMSKADPASFESFLNLPLATYEAELRRELAEAKLLQKFSTQFLQTAPEDDLSRFEQDRQSHGELTTLRDWHGRTAP
jgi:hypothetical protein